MSLLLQPSAIVLAAVASRPALAATPAMSGRRQTLAAAAAAAAAANTASARAWCGDPYPPFAYSLPWFEFDSSGCAVRVVGDLTSESGKGLRPLVALPTPGLSYDYLENLEALTVSQRRVAFIAVPPAASLPAATRAAVDAIGSLDAKRGVHLLAHGLAAPVALAAAAAAPPGAVASLLLSSPLSQPGDAEPASARAIAASTAPLLATASASSSTVCVGASLARPAAAELHRAFAANELPPLPALVRALRSPPPPLLLAHGGASDVSSAAAVDALAAAAEGRAEVSLFARSGPLPMVDEKAAYAEAVLRFLDSVDGATTRRVVVSGGDQRVAGRI